MPDHGLLFVDSLARRLAQGRKTATRRPMSVANTVDYKGLLARLERGEVPALADSRVQPGDNVWVRETWRIAALRREDGLAMICYRAGGSYSATIGEGPPAKIGPYLDSLAVTSTWRPSIHMPRWTARTVLPVVEVEPERLHTLSDEEALAEGFDSSAEFTNAWNAIYRARGQTVTEHPWVWVTRLGAKTP